MVLDNIIWSGFVRDLLVFGPKHPIRDKFKELYFLADIESLIKKICVRNMYQLKNFLKLKRQQNCTPKASEKQL